MAASAALAALAGCCAPAKCVQARSGTAILDTALAQIDRYKDRTGRYPVSLDDIAAGYQDHLRWDFKEACRDCGLPRYATDSYGYSLEFEYKSHGKVLCRHDSESESWNCKGIY